MDLRCSHPHSGRAPERFRPHLKIHPLPGAPLLACKQNLYFRQRFFAAFLAISFRFFADMPAARSLPPCAPAAAFLPSSVVMSSISPVAILAIMMALPMASSDPSTNSEGQVRCEARIDREQHRSSAPGVFGNRVAQMKLVEQLTLVTLHTAHHGSTSPRFASHNGIAVRDLSNRLLQQNLPLAEVQPCLPCGFRAALVSLSIRITSTCGAAMVEYPARRIDYREQGSGPTILFVPGSWSTGALWRDVIALLGDRFRAVTTSPLGYGDTEERRTPDDVSIDREIDVIEAVIRRTEQRCPPRWSFVRWHRMPGDRPP